MGLKLKIFTGYFLLIALLIFVIYLFHGEQVKKSTLKKEEQELTDTQRLTEEAYLALFNLASHAEIVCIWEQDDLDLYHEKREETCNLLKTLKEHVHTSGEQARIDSLCMLLSGKEYLLATAMNTYHELIGIGEIVTETLPAIASEVQRLPLNKTDPDNEPEKTTSKRKGFWGIFHKKEKPSAYRKQKEQQERESVKMKANPQSAPTAMIRSLHREVSEKQKMQREKLLLQMDSLYESSMTLNQRLNGLIGDFEKDASLRLYDKYKAQVLSREDSYRLVSGIAAFVFFLAIIFYIIVHRDINKRNKYKQALELSDRRNKELLSSRKSMMLTIAHDLRAPLAAIKGCAELLPDEKDKRRQDEYAENIQHSSDYMLSLVNTLLDFYLLDTGKSKQNIAIFQLKSFFKETADRYAALAAKKRLRFTTEFSGLDIVASGDCLHIQQIINNILDNAVKFTRQGEIILHAEYRNEQLVFSVRDTGMGMTAEEKERVFTAFERLDNARYTPGFGLGLAISYKLACRMGGTIEVESKPGEGSTFMVFLPLPRANEATRLDEEHSSVFQPGEISVLLIDDDRIQLNITREMFRRNRIKCDCCRTSWELITRLRTGKYDLLLTDIQMPETDGFGILELLRSSNMQSAKAIPVMAVTALADDKKDYISSGFVGCIHKPFSMEELIRAVAEVMGDRIGKKKRNPDFSLILTDEDDKREMLAIFIRETAKDLSGLVDAVERKDGRAVVAILHKNLPLWETVNLDFPLSHLRDLVTCDPENWTDRQYEETREIINAVQKLIAFAKKIQEVNK